MVMCMQTNRNTDRAVPLLAGLGLAVLLLGQTAAFAQAPAAQKVRASKKTTAAVAPAELLSPEQLAIAEKVTVGKMPCDLAVNVVVKPDSHLAGRFLVELGKQSFVMVPVATTTGAVRLEDARAGAVWLQLANKSMLMHQKAGKRLADACMSEGQRDVAQSMERSPVPSVLDAPAPATTDKTY